ncbi:meiotic recombination protein REC114 [Porphyrio hochstetteri]
MAGGGHGSEPGQASSLLGSATTWPLKRYGRFLPPKDGEDEGQNTSSWKVYESNEESGYLVLTIVVSGHFFISQGQMVLEGFSLIESHKWLNVARRAECLLLRARAKNECRIFRVQFGGDTKEQMLGHCCSCVQKLAEYLPVEVTDEQRLSQLAVGESHVKDTEQSAWVLHRPGNLAAKGSHAGLGEEGKLPLKTAANATAKRHLPTPSQVEPDEPLPESCTSLGERRSVTQLAQSVLRKELELPLAYRHSAWRAQELGPFIRLCLLDQSFPAFVEDVEKELKKLTEG